MDLIIWQTTIKIKILVLPVYNWRERVRAKQDWKGTILNDDVMVWKNGASIFPKHLDGSGSNWEFYSNWKPSSGNDWIVNHGSENVWGNIGKSMIIDLSNDGWGPNGFGLYFGDGSSTSGYEDIYIFHMMWIPKNQWPKYIDHGNSVGTYTEGQDYAYFWSWKSGLINIGMNDTHKYNGSQNVYSPFHIYSHIKSEYAGAFNKKMSMVLEPYDDGKRYSYWATGKAVHDILPEWWGVEYHFRNQSNVTYMDVWIYDANGSSWQIINNKQVSYTSQPASHKWNDWFFGVNNSATYKWGPTMNSTYYVDDFIIHGSRIGPTYFSLLNNQPPPSDTMSPLIPSNLTVTVIFSSQINLSWTASTDNVGVTGYKVYRNGQLVNSLNSLTYSDTGLTASTTYSYTISAYDAAGNESNQSIPASAITLASFKPSDLNQDAKVNQLDFDILKQNFNRTDKPVSDLNQDGIVDSGDLGILMSEWSKS